MAGSGGAGGGKRTPLGAFLYWTTVLGVWGAIFVVVFLVVFAQGLPDTSKLNDVKRQPSITYLDRTGVAIAVRGSQYAPPIDVDSLPAYVPAAFVAIEDRRFYHHPGFDPIGMGRALFRDAKSGHLREGASTITQQLARNLFLTPDQNLKRKIQEIELAVWLEHKFTKKQILGLYMNRVYFGAGAYGIEAASQRYFDKSAKDLTVGEAALLAGMMKGPSRYSPVGDKERAARRATVVLDEMVKSGVITPQQRAEAVAAPVQVSRTLASQHAQYFIDWLDQEVRGLVGDQKEDLVVETTLDLSLEASAEQAVRQIVARDQKRGVQQAALVALDGDGRVRALVGGADYGESQFDRAVDARRQVGSSWKPFVYLAAMEAGRTPDTPVVDEPVTIDGWTPHNFEPDFMGPITIETALVHSINTVAARTADEIGRDKVAEVARRLGVTGNIGLEPAMALGAVEVSPLEMAQAYGAFANGGLKVKAHGITRIRTQAGRVLYEWRDDVQRARVIANPPLSEMNRMLRQVLVAGTGKVAAIPGYDLAGKTGTTSDFKDAWFVGYTGGFSTAVWVGKDDNTPMRKVTGGSSPATIWRMFMQSALPRLRSGPIPGGIPAPSNDPIGDLLNGTEIAPPASSTPPTDGATGEAVSGAPPAAGVTGQTPGASSTSPASGAPATPPKPIDKKPEKKKDELFY
jgi:penicillin-binding protein 1A